MSAEYGFHIKTGMALWLCFVNEELEGLADGKLQIHLHCTNASSITQLRNLL